MDRRRLLKFPPEVEGLPNRFSKLPAYRYSQHSFKTFSDEEIVNQAGGESLPTIESKGSDSDSEDEVRGVEGTALQI